MIAVFVQWLFYLSSRASGFFFFCRYIRWVIWTEKSYEFSVEFRCVFGYVFNVESEEFFNFLFRV